MRAVVQRVTQAAVHVGEEVVGAIDHGLVVLVGVTHGDDEAAARALARRVFHLRVFDDGAGRMNRSVAETGGALLVVSQFTLYGDTSRGRRPSWSAAARPERAEPLVTAFTAALRDLGVPVATGVFGAHMRVRLENDGPVTLLVEVAGANPLPAGGEGHRP